MSGKAKICGNCKWHVKEEITQGKVCVNGDSEKCTEFTEIDDTCRAWEGTCKTCEWYVESALSFGSGGKACVNKHSEKFMSGGDDSCRHWQERNVQADSEIKKILDNL